MWSKLGQMIVDRLVIAGLKYLGTYLPKLISDWIKEREQKAAQAAAKKEHDAVVANPESTPQEIADAYKKYRNSGK